MAADLVPKEIYSAGGIDQSEKPRPDSVDDACNIDTSRGIWKSRPGWAKVKKFDTGYTGFDPFFKLLTEYIPDRRYATSHYYSVIMAYQDSLGFHRWREFNEGGTTTLAAPIPSTVGGEHQLTEADGLWRDVNNPDPDLWYVPVKVFSNGYDAPVFYHQKAPDHIGQIDELDAVDGGDSSLTYLTEPPKAKIYVIYKDRLFALNTESGDNVAQHTGLYENAAYVVNVWPAEFNFSIGTGDEITGAKVLNDVLYIFKKREIWALSGDGIGGNWQLERVDAEHGAFSNRMILETGDSLIFLGGKGEAFYRFDGNRVVNISHPRLQKLWKEYDWSNTTRQGKNMNGIFDETERRCIFVVNQHGHSPNTFSYGMLVYNLDNDSWDRWGDWPGYPREKTAFKLPYSKNVMPVILMNSKEWYDDRSAVVGISHTYDRGEGYMCTLKGPVDMHIDAGVDKIIPIHWYIMTHRYFNEDSQSKLLRRFMIYAKQTGTWYITALALKDDDEIVDAVHRKEGDNWNIIIDSQDSQQHAVNGESKLRTAGDGPVDVIYLPTLHKLHEYRSLESAPPNNIKFSSSLDSTDMNSLLLVMKEMRAAMKNIYMIDRDQYYFGGSVAGGYEGWGNSIYRRPKLKKLTRGENLVGRNFRMYFSNVGTEYNDDDADNVVWAKACSITEIHGWGLWIRRRGVMSPEKPFKEA
jgi:hypothetical protein